MGRTERHRWWKPPLAIGCAIPLSFGLGLFFVLVLELVKAIQHIPADVAELGHPVADLAVELVLVIVLLPAVLIAVRVVQRRRAGTLSSVEGRLRWRWLLRCTAVAVGCVVVSFGGLMALLVITEPGEPLFGEFAGMETFLAALAVIFLLVPFQAAAEEYALRGFFMQLVGGYGDPTRPGRSAPGRLFHRFLASPVPAILVSGLIFTLLHDYYDWALLDVAVFGLGMAWLTWYTGGLEAAIALHVVHNLVAFVLAAYEGDFDSSGDTGSWQSLLATIVEVSVFCLVVAWMRRKQAIRHTTPEAEATPPARPQSPPPSPQWS